MKTFSSLFLHLLIGIINISTMPILFILRRIVRFVSWFNNYTIVKIQKVLAKLGSHIVEEVEADHEYTMFSKLDEIPPKYIEKYLRKSKLEKFR